MEAGPQAIDDLTASYQSCDGAAQKMADTMMDNAKGSWIELKSALEGKEYIIRRIETDDEELDGFLFSLGCYSGEPVTVVSRLKKSCMVSIKDARYNIDKQLAQAILV